MEVLPAGGGRTGLPQPGARPEDSGRGASPSERARSSRGSREGEEDPESGEPRGSRTASLVSGLLTELYSCTEEEETVGGARAPRGRQRRRDSLDSSTEASGSDVFLGGRGGAGDSRVLQELQERPSPRHQMQYLRRKDMNELETILQELKYRIGIQSAKLLRQLKQKDRLVHKVQRNCDIVTACLQAVSQKRTAKRHNLEVMSLLPYAAAAAAAKSLQSCPTLCDPIDGSPPGSRSLEFSRQEHWSGLPFPSPMCESEK